MHKVVSTVATLLISSAEPFFRAFHTVMEGNNEVDIDGRERRLDYLDNEDSCGKVAALNEEAFFDEISVVTA